MPRAPHPLATASPNVYLNILGAFRLIRGNEPAYLPTRKIEALLTYLVLYPEEHSRDKLASLFWGDVSDAQARASLRNALPILRRHVGDDLLIADRETVKCNPHFPLWVDALEFEKLVSERATSREWQAAIELYRGDLLSDFYEDWILAEREHYRILYLDALLRLTQEMRSQSEYERAGKFARRVLASDPANERAHQHLMFCYLAAGDRSAALQQFEDCKRMLQEELAVEPMPESIALYQWIQQATTERKATEALVTNLPIPVSSFIGRTLEMKEVKELLSNARLVTLTGAGGSGKTRLAVQVAMDLIDQFKDGVWWVDLASLADEKLVPHAVAKTLSVREESNEPLLVTIASFLRSRHLMLVLDNCEHLIAACAQLVERLLSACGQVRILTTSRETLGITGEHIFPVHTLSLPEPHELSLAQFLLRHDAIRLFHDRAIAVRSDFAVTDQNALAVLHVCQRVDGIPLAIELAAARVKATSVEEIAARLDKRLNFLTMGSRTAPPRQQTLRATLDWSHELLTEHEKMLFRRLSVFAAGCTFEAAEQVCAHEGIESDRIFDLLSKLVAKSLVMAEPQGGGVRYRMLETLREYAREKLMESGDTTKIRDRHLAFFLELAEEAERTWHGRQQLSWLNRLETEHDNLRSALEWSRESNVELGLRVATALWRFWAKRGYLTEGRERLEAILFRASETVQTSIRAKALAASGNMACYQGDYASARALIEQSLALRREAGDEHGIGSALRELGVVVQSQGHYTAARSLYQESLAISQKIGDHWGTMATLGDLGQVAWNQGDYILARSCVERALEIGRVLQDKAGIAYSLNSLGLIAWSQGEYDRLRALSEEGLMLYQELNDKWGIAHVVHSLGIAALGQGDYAAARAHTEQSLELFRQYGDKWGIAYALQSFAELAAAKARLESTSSVDAPRVSEVEELLRAARLFGATEALCEAIGAHLEPAVRAHAERHVAIVRSQLGEESFAAAWAEGRTMTMDQAIALALERPYS